MNKIYLEPISKAKNFIDGVRKQKDLLAKKGIDVDVEKLESLCCSLEENGRLQDEAEKNLKQAREKAHVDLNALKEFYSLSKTPIKQAFPPETWFSFGLVDKK